MVITEQERELIRVDIRIALDTIKREPEINAKWVQGEAMHAEAIKRACDRLERFIAAVKGVE